MRLCDPIGLAKAILWEEAKGKLRALVAADGAEHAKRGVSEISHFQKLETAIDKFISDFEGEGLHE